MHSGGVGVNRANGQRFLLKAAAVIAVALAMLWPAFVNGEPFYMPDTPSYIRGADGAIHELTGVSTVWSDELQKRFSAKVEPKADVRPAAPAQAVARKVPAEPNVVLKGRSIYYGALLYAAQWLGHFWAMGLFQALLCTVAIALTIQQVGRAMGRETTPATLLAAGLAMAALTPAGYFASYLLPDVFGALGLLAFGNLLFFWNCSRPVVRLFWFALLTAAVLFHASNILLIASLSVIVALGLFVKLPASKTGFAAVGVALLIALLGQLAFAWGVKHATGASPIRPPFLAARIIDDGPGYEYLKEHCPEARLIYCRVLGFRTRDSATLLWSADPKEGVFQALPPAEQRLATAQQNGFVANVIKERPLEVLGSSTMAFLKQLTFFQLESFNYTRANNSYFRDKLPEPFLDHAKQSKAYHRSMPVRFVEWATILSVIAAVAAVALAVRGSLRREKKLTAVTSFLLLLTSGVLVNAAICGALSTPRGRYQMRLIWVLPLAALATCRARIGADRSGTLVETRAGAAAAG